MKNAIISKIESKGFEVIDYGTNSTESVDYPDFVHPVADFVQAGGAIFGVLICGSGNGVAMTANKHKGIRAAISWDRDLAILARQHNNANIIAIPARFVDETSAVAMVEVFIDTEFEGGRHGRRINKINC